MAAVDRADYMDNSKVAEVEQTIRKEKDIQRAYFAHQERLGNLKLRAPTPPKPRRSLKSSYGIPGHLRPVQSDPEQSMAMLFSRQLWSNAMPDYAVRDPRRTISTMKDSFVWNEDEIEYMKNLGMLEKTYNRKRDEHTQYTECKAMYETMMKSGSIQ